MNQLIINLGAYYLKTHFKSFLIKFSKLLKFFNSLLRCAEFRRGTIIKFSFFFIPSLRVHKKGLKRFFFKIFSGSVHEKIDYLFQYN